MVWTSHHNLSFFFGGGSKICTKLASQTDGGSSVECMGLSLTPVLSTPTDLWDCISSLRGECFSAVCRSPKGPLDRIQGVSVLGWKITIFSLSASETQHFLHKSMMIPNPSGTSSSWDFRHHWTGLFLSRYNCYIYLKIAAMFITTLKLLQ